MGQLLNSDNDLVGRSVPNFEFEEGTKIGDLMHDGRGVLLDFEMSNSFKAVASEYGERINYISGRAKEQLGLRALLIRPDGIVAWASDGRPDEQSIRQAMASWFQADS
jgi:hypothetical protein